MKKKSHSKTTKKAPAAPGLIPKKINFDPAILARAVARHKGEIGNLRQFNAHTFVGLINRLARLYGDRKIDAIQKEVTP